MAFSVVAKAVIMMTTVSGAASFTLRSSSRPEAPASCTSEITTSKSSAVIASGKQVFHRQLVEPAQRELVAGSCEYGREFAASLARGNLFAVSDFADFMGQGVTPDHADCRLMIPHHDFGVNAALLVRSTLGLKNINRYQLHGDRAAHYPWVARQYADEAGTDWCDMDFGQLLGNTDFLKVEAQFGN